MKPRLINSHIAEMEEAAALPRGSGELVFHDPWERRIFSLTVALHEQGADRQRHLHPGRTASRIREDPDSIASDPYLDQGTFQVFGAFRPGTGCGWRIGDPWVEGGIKRRPLREISDQ